MLFFFIGGFALPAGALLYFVASPNVCFLFVLTAVLYYLNYELLHFAYHCEPHSIVGSLPVVRRLRKRHLAHHNKSLMTKFNFNITYPLCDYAFGTLYRENESSVQEP